MKTPAYIVAAKRTPIGKYQGGLSHIRSDDLMSQLIFKMRISEKKIDFDALDDFILGCAIPEGEQGQNMARHTILTSGLAEHIPGMVVNRLCASGLDSIGLAASKIMSGQADLVLAGGVESLSRIPLTGFSYSPNPIWFQHYPHLCLSMGLIAENVSKKLNISREEQDSYALTSHQKALVAIQDHLFRDEIISIEECLCDEGPRKTSLELLARLKPSFSKNGTVTAGNSSTLADGAAAVVLASEKALLDYKLDPLGEFLGYQVSSSHPSLIGPASIHAIKKLTKNLQIDLSKISWFEINEAFATQCIGVIRNLHVDEQLINPYGGSIAFGHPLGASGTMRVITSLYGLKRKIRHDSFALIAMCAGSGLGSAGLIKVFS